MTNRDAQQSSSIVSPRKRMPQSRCATYRTSVKIKPQLYLRFVRLALDC